MIGRMIGVALDVHHLRGHVFRAITDRVDDGAAANRAVRASRPCLARAGYLQRPELRVGRLQIETKERGSGSSNSANLQEITAGRVHTGTPIREK
jgi:hypothetical protein